MNFFKQIHDRLRSATVYGMFLTDGERNGLEQEMNDLMEVIKLSATFESAQNELQQLGLMQETLATMCFGYKIELTERQRKLVREYDRWDLPEIRESSYNAIKKGQFP